MLGLSIFLEGLVNRNHISRFTQLNQARNLSKYSPVVVPVEISLIDDIANPLPNGIIDQQPAEQGLLCLDGVRWHTQMIQSGVGDSWLGRTLIHGGKFKLKRPRYCEAFWRVG